MEAVSAAFDPYIDPAFLAKYLMIECDSKMHPSGVSKAGILPIGCFFKYYGDFH